MRIFINCIMAAVFILLPLNTLYSKSLWNDKNIYSSGSNLSVGDILYVTVRDLSQLKFSVKLNNNSSFSIMSNPDRNITGFLPKTSSDRKINNSDKTDFSGSGNLSISIAARITERLKDGNLKIAGTRVYSFNGVVNRFRVSGIVDPAIMSGRSVLSNDVADFILEVRGRKEGAAIDFKRKALKEGETASSALTEQEKQKIIIDYLKNILMELTR